MMLPLVTTLVRYADFPPGTDPTGGIGDLVFAAAHVAPLLEKEGLLRLDAVDTWQFSGLVEQNWGRYTTQVRIGNIRAFLKRERCTYRKDRLVAYVLPGLYTTKAVQELAMLQHLRLYGVACPRPLALWLHRSGHQVEAAILLEFLEGYVPLDEYLSSLVAAGRLDQTELYRLLEGLAAFVVRMHNARVHNPDLFAWHVFVRVTATTPSPNDFAVIDLQRAVPLAWRPCCVRRARDLGALLATLSDRIVPPLAREHFLESYLRLARPKDPWKPFFRAVLDRRIARWRARSKVRQAIKKQENALLEASESVQDLVRLGTAARQAPA